MNHNLVLMPLGAGSLWFLWSTRAGSLFWVASGAFWLQCLMTLLIERLGEDAPDASVVLSVLSMLTVVAAAVYWIFAG